jgi:hypothetical protein
MVRDLRVEEQEGESYMYDENRAQNLGAYFTAKLEEADARSGTGSREQESWRNEEDEERSKPGTVTTTCPVCHVFEGDERAVAYHVEQHFAGT